MQEVVTLQELLVWGFGSIRVVALLLLLPPFSHNAVPIRARILLAVFVFALAVPDRSLALQAVQQGSLGVMGSVFSEALIGLGLGFAVRLVFAAFGLMGEFASIQGGLGAARVLDPSTGQTSVALAALFDLFMLVVFLAIDGHHAVLLAIAKSYTLLPLGSGGPSAQSFLEVARMGGDFFEIAVRLAAPVTVATFISNIALGILARVAPQLNLMMVQLPAHIAVTLAILALGAGTLMDSGVRSLEAWSEQAIRLFVGVS